MRIYVNLDTLEIESAGSRPPGASDVIGGRMGLAGRIYSKCRLEVGFFREASNDVLVDLGADIGLTWLLKRNEGTQKFDDPALVSCTSFAREEEGDNFLYVGNIDLAVPNCEKLLGVDNAQQKEIVTIQCVADVGGSLNEKYFDLFHGSGDTDFQRVWFNNGTGTAPASGGGTLIECPYVTNNAASAIATLLALGSFGADTHWDVAQVGDTLTFTAKQYEARGWHNPRNSGFTITTTQAGMAGTGLAEDEDSATLISEVSFEYAGELQIAEIFNFILENALRRPGATNPGSASGSNVRRGTVDIASGVSEAAAVFSSPFPSAAWRFRDLRVVNTTDATPLNIFPGIITARSATGFTVKFNGDTDTANYDLEYTCEL